MQQDLFVPNQEVHLARETLFTWNPGPDATSDNSESGWYHDSTRNATFWYNPQTLALPARQTLQRGTSVRIRMKTGDNIKPGFQDVVNPENDHIPGLCRLYDVYPVYLPVQMYAISEEDWDTAHSFIEPAPIHYKPPGLRLPHASYLKGTILAVPEGNIELRTRASAMTGAGFKNTFFHVGEVLSRNSGGVAKPGTHAKLVKYKIKALAPVMVHVPFECPMGIPEEWLYD